MGGPGLALAASRAAGVRRASSVQCGALRISPSTRQLGFWPPAHTSLSCGGGLGLGAELSHLPGVSSPDFLHTCYSKYCINMGPLRGHFILDFET